MKNSKKSSQNRKRSNNANSRRNNKKTNSSSKDDDERLKYEMAKDFGIDFDSTVSSKKVVYNKNYFDI